MEGAVRIARQKVYEHLGENDPWEHLKDKIIEWWTIQLELFINLFVTVYSKIILLYVNYRILRFMFNKSFLSLMKILVHFQSIYIPYHFSFSDRCDPPQMLEKCSWHLFVYLGECFLSLTFKWLNSLYDISCILLHISCKLELFRKLFVLIHLDVPWLKDVWTDCKFPLDFIFVDYPDWIPFPSVEIV